MTFNEAVTIDAGTQLTLSNGGVATLIGQVAGHPDQFKFSYTPTTNIVNGHNQDASQLSIASIQGGIQDLAGNAFNLNAVTDSPIALPSILIDVTAPDILAMSVNRPSQQVSLTFDSAIDPDPNNLNHALIKSAFTVTTVIGGTPSANLVASIAIDPNNDHVIILTLTNAFDAGQVNVTYADPTLGNDSIAIQDLAGNDMTSFFSGQVVDGYIRGAEISIAVIDPVTHAEILISTGVTTNAQGNFFLPNVLPDGSPMPQGALVISGGVNIDTGLPNTTVLRAPAGATVINPLTTMVEPTGT